MSTISTMLMNAQNDFLRFMDPNGIARGSITKDWWLSDLPSVATIVFAYLAFVFIGPRIMKNRAAPNLYGLKFAYNISQMLLCAYMSIEALFLMHRNGFTLLPACQPFDRVDPPVARLLWLFYAWSCSLRPECHCILVSVLALQKH